VTFAREAIAFLKRAHSDDAGNLALELARVVLRGATDAPGEWTRLALEIRDGGPSWAAKAVTLAAAVLEEAIGDIGRVDDAGHGEAAAVDEPVEARTVAESGRAVRLHGRSTCR
jgi:hypothetical protein